MTHLKEKLLKVSGANLSNDYVCKGKVNQQKNTGQGSIKLRRRFLLRLAVALHSYGSSASRTEYLIEKAADRLGIDIDVAVFPALILLSFPEVTHDPSRKEIHLLTVEPGLDANKLGQADELANDVGKEGLPLAMSYWQLKNIATSLPVFGKWGRLFSFALSASMAAPLFFEGNVWDAFVSFMLGLIVGVLDIIASKSALFATVLEFTASLTASFLAQLASMYLKQFKLCFSSMALSSIVNLLPGLPLALGVSEIVSKSHVTGTSRIVNALFSALLLGFGFNIGKNLVWWVPEPDDSTCAQTDQSLWWNVLWFVGYTVASNVLLNARVNQWPGMALASGIGYIASFFASMKFDANTANVVAAFAVGIAGTSYSFITGDLPLVPILSGVLLLVPGGIGVRGVAAMLNDDVLSGMGIVFNMMVVGLAVTIGLLLSKIVLPAALFGAGKSMTNNKYTLAAQLEKDHADEEDENVAP